MCCGATWAAHTRFFGNLQDGLNMRNWFNNWNGDPPSFVDWAAGDFHLLPDDPGVDAGMINGLFTPFHDIDEDNRPMRLGRDIGVEEVRD